MRRKKNKYFSPRMFEEKSTIHWSTFYRAVCSKKKVPFIRPLSGYFVPRYFVSRKNYSTPWVLFTSCFFQKYHFLRVLDTAHNYVQRKKYPIIKVLFNSRFISRFIPRKKYPSSAYFLPRVWFQGKSTLHWCNFYRAIYSKKKIPFIWVILTACSFSGFISTFYRVFCFMEKVPFIGVDKIV